jgi:hypothetical protein
MIALGTEMKFDVHIEPIGELSMSDYDFECAFFVYANKKVVIKKSDMIKINKDHYLAIIETEQALKLGKGRIQLEITSYVPDSDFSDGVRTEKTIVCTDVIVS